MLFVNGFKSNKRMQAQQNAGVEISFIYEELVLVKRNNGI
jgi:hypothetical protein